MTGGIVVVKTIASDVGLVAGFVDAGRREGNPAAWFSANVPLVQRRSQVPMLEYTIQSFYCVIE